MLVLGRLNDCKGVRSGDESQGVRYSLLPRANRAENCTNLVASAIQRVLFRDICQMGSLAGAAYLLHDNAGVLRQAQWEQNSHVEHKRKGLLD